MGDFPFVNFFNDFSFVLLITFWRDCSGWFNFPVIVGGVREGRASKRERERVCVARVGVGEG